MLGISGALFFGGILSAAAEATLLTIVSTDNEAIAQFTDETLSALPQHSFETTTTWTEGLNRYSGPSLASVLAHAGLETDTSIKLVAANDYASTLVPGLIDDTFPIVAIRVNEKPFSLREKGPLWVIYPFDDEEKYQTETHFSASVWQLTTIALLDE